MFVNRTKSKGLSDKTGDDTATARPRRKMVKGNLSVEIG
jgi:hypothetical protein